MGIYEGKDNTAPNSEEMEALYGQEFHLYGSSRLGIKRSDQPDTDLGTYSPPVGTTQRISGKRSYELSNHLGNVLAAISDNKLLAYQGNALPLYKAELLSFSDYYPFGWEMPERSGSSELYRYGFNGKEKDESGEFGNLTHYDYGFRIYNPGIGRFLSVDPLTADYPGWSPYPFAMNRVIDGVDLDGLEYANSTTGKEAGPISNEELLNSKEGYSESIDVNGNGVQDHILPSVEVVASRSENNINSNSGVAKTEKKKEDPIDTNLFGAGINVASLTAAGYNLSLSEKLKSTKQFLPNGTITAINGKIYPANSGANGSKGPKSSWKVNLSTVENPAYTNTSLKQIHLTGIGNSLTVISTANTIYQHNTGQINDIQFVAEIGVTGILYRFPNPYTVAVGIGWETGRIITMLPIYQRNVHPDEYYSKPNHLGELFDLY